MEEESGQRAKGGKLRIVASWIKVGGGIVAAYLLFGALVNIMDTLAFPIEHALGYMQELQAPPALIPRSIGWAVAAGLAWWCFKPSTRIWANCFGLFTLLLMLVSCARADTQEEQISLDSGKGMFFISAIITVVGMTRLRLGEGPQQAKALREMIGLSSSEPSAIPNESLLRASAPPELPHDTLLRPAKDTAEASPEQLLRASQSEEL